MGRFREREGFTLVELIVVIAILAILAGAYIPVYNGYIRKAEHAAISVELDAIAVAAQAANATQGGIDSITVNEDSIIVSAARYAENFDADFVLYYSNAEDADTRLISIGVFNILEPFGIDRNFNGKAMWTPDVGWEPESSE